MAAASCSNIDEGDRLIYVKPAEVGRTVLIEDLTGQRCINCPTGTDIINGIIETYGEDNVIAVGIHCGPLGFAGNSKRVGLKTDTGDEYFTHWANGTKLYQPSAIFNRKKGPNDSFNNWAAEVGLIISEKANLSVNIANTYDAKTRTLTTKVGAFGVNGTVSGKLQVWIVEDGVKAFQMMPDGSANLDYVHNHVFRAAVNGTWGEEVTVKEGETTTKQYSYEHLPETWNAENISVVAFVYNDNGVENVAKKHIVEHEEETEK